MVLLDLLHDKPHLRLVIAHLDHGIREDSKQDREFVEAAAQAYGLPFEYREAQLGPAASEAAARAVRYNFLEDVRCRSKAQGIITAHHQDDLIETALLNLIRGTGRRGLSSLRSTDTILRPLLGISKQQIKEYARDQNIQWREDSTNQDERYLRNFVRRQLVSRLSADQRQQLTEQLLSAVAINQELDKLLLDALQAHLTVEGVERQWFISLPHDVSTEIMATWLRSAGIRAFDRKVIERLVIAAKTSLPGKRLDVMAGNELHIGKYHLRLVVC